MAVTIKAPLSPQRRSPSPGAAASRARSLTARTAPRAERRPTPVVTARRLIQATTTSNTAGLRLPATSVPPEPTTPKLAGIREALGFIEASYVREVDPIDLTWKGLDALRSIEPTLQLEEIRPEDGTDAWELVVTARGQVLGTYPLDQTYATQIKIIESAFVGLKKVSPSFARATPEARRATFLRGVMPELGLWARYLTPEEIQWTLQQYAPPATEQTPQTDAPPPPPSISRTEIWDTTGFIELPVFGSRTHTEISEAVAEMKSKGVTDVIIDLRRNDGGMLATAVLSADLFVPAGLLLAQRGRDPQFATSYEATEGSPHESTDLRVVILVSGDTASAAEIFAAALADVGRAVVVGTPSFGKGSSQWHAPLNTGDGLKFTVSEFTGPTGATIDTTGVIPAVCVTPDQNPEPSVLGPSNIFAAARTRRNEKKLVNTQLASECPLGAPSTGASLRVAEALLRDPEMFRRALAAQKLIANSSPRPRP